VIYKGDLKMSSDNTICAVCAWRATCQKKFSVSGKDMKCADFVRDISIKEEKETEEIDSEKK
jgi:hypothetical protein